MPTVLAETTRGGIVESVHRGAIAVVDSAGHLVAAAGDVAQVFFYRSSAKPFQAIPVVESGVADRFGWTERELALCCASHSGEPHHQAEVRAMLASIGLTPDALQCGCVVPYNDAEGARVAAGIVEMSPLQCDCSGKHTGMLATCVHEGLPIDTYLEPSHPLQRRILSLMAELLRMPADAIVLGTDGCSLPTFAAPLRAFAASWATLADPDAAPSGAGREHARALRRLRAAMLAAPENVAGTGEFVTDLMRLGEGRIVAKSGAEGLICLALPERGLGIAIRILDGSFRAHPVVVAETLRQLDAIDRPTIDALLATHSPELRNHNRRHVGDIRPAFGLLDLRPPAPFLRPPARFRRRSLLRRRPAAHPAT
ncbi:MAG TPA: asparaginase [Thermomicrobiales bacterium]|nr:asparaginase [Thermomicrobiales bacterium]